jgi:DNA-binding XRE family transcriptional regulator
MAKDIVVSLGGKESTFSYKAVDRASLYGKRKRVLLDEQGEPCSRASLLEDGSLLIKSGMTAQGYFLSDGRSYKQSELEGFDLSGKPLSKAPSTLGVSQELKEVSAEDALNVSQQTVYALEANQLDESLKKSLDEGKVFSFPFNYREDYQAETALLVSNDNGYFAIIGQPIDYEWVGFKSVVDLPPESEDSDEDLDFEMF